jgi:hypothetical protein
MGFPEMEIRFYRQPIETLREEWEILMLRFFWFLRKH